ELQRAGGVHQPRAVQVERGRPGRHRAGGEDAVLEADAVAVVESQGALVLERGLRLDVRDLPVPGRFGEVAGQRVDDLVLAGAERVDVDPGRGEVQAPAVPLAGVGDQPRGVQQGLGRDAADEQADAARSGVGVDQGYLQPAVGGQERGRVPPRAGADYDQ